MPSGYESGAKKTIDISIKAEKMTADVLKSALQEFLSGKAEKKGRMTFKQFIRLLCAFRVYFTGKGAIPLYRIERLTYYNLHPLQFPIRNDSFYPKGASTPSEFLLWPSMMTVLTFPNSKSLRMRHFWFSLAE